MSLIDKNFLKKQFLNMIKHRIIFNIKIKNIDIKMHDNSKYVNVNFYFQKKCRDEIMIVQLKIKFHLIDDLKAQMFIKMNIMNSKQMILNFDNKIMIISTCENIEISISFHRKNASIDRTIRAAAKIIVSMKTTMIISIRIKKFKISTNRSYNFYFKIKRQLKSKNKYFAYVTKIKMIAIQIKNTSTKSYVISKNFKIEHFCNYDEKNCFLTTSKNNHLIVISNQILNVKTLKTNEFIKTMLLNDITIYENEFTVKKLQIISKTTSNV